MITLIVLLALLIVFMTIGLCFHIAGGVLKLVFKLIFCLPCAVICVAAGIVLCCTLILIPVGIGCFKLAGGLLNPFRMCVL